MAMMKSEVPTTSEEYRRHREAYQARIAALQIKGKLKRPADVAARAATEAGKRRERFGSAPRHLVEVDYHDFRRALLRELGDHAVNARQTS